MLPVYECTLGIHLVSIIHIFFKGRPAVIIIGLTGSIGMGKSTLSAMMENLGIPVHDADKCVRLLLKNKSEARPAIAAAFPYFQFPEIYEKKTYDLKHKEFGAMIFSHDNHRETLESILHPFVHKSQNEFIRAQRLKGIDIVCLDIPLLFETGSENRVDHIITVSAPDFIQRERVLARPHMTGGKFNAILARQMPDAEKCARSDYVIKTGLGRFHSLKCLRSVLTDIRHARTTLPIHKVDALK